MHRLARRQGAVDVAVAILAPSRVPHRGAARVHTANKLYRLCARAIAKLCDLSVARPIETPLSSIVRGLGYIGALS